MGQLVGNHRQANGPTRMAATSVAAICTLAILAFCLAGCGATRADRTAHAPGAVAGADASSTIRVESVHLSAAGNYVDVRYRVLDAARATQALGPKVRPRLVDARTGLEMGVPTTAKLGSLRQTQGQQRTGRTYFILFVNSARVGTGDEVALQVGELQVAHLRVQ